MAGQRNTSTPILTPDRRLRIFVSSTLEELVGERAAARDAIKAMHLAPIMFELGARPHPPRTLYQAYLQQSDVFVGIYWQKYGWMAPHSDISGLEDEYLLSEGMPRLIYVREPAPDREPRLSALIGRFMAEGLSSFKVFSDPDELATLLADDLALMVTERFGPRTKPGAPQLSVPQPVSGVRALLVTDIPDERMSVVPFGSQEAEAAHRRLTARLRGAVAGHGQVFDLGDALLAVLSVPSDAVRAAVEFQQAVVRDATLKSAAPSGVRVGITLAEATEEEQNDFGSSLIAAERLCRAATAGQVLVTAPVRAIGGSRIAEELRAVDSPALSAPSDGDTVFEVLWRPTAAARYPAPPELAATVAQGELIGRTEEMAELHSQWAHVGDGRRGLACVAGEPGIGKTRLVAEFAADLHEHGATVLWGRSSEELLVPYQPFIQALQHYAATCPERDLREQLGASARVIARIIPVLRERFPDLPDPPGDEPESERYRLFDAISSSLAAMSQSAPVLLVLDDLQWADRATLLLMTHLLRDARPASLLVLATYRDTEGTQVHLLSDILADLRRDRAFLRIHLEGLPEEDVGPLVESLAGSRPSVELAAQLFSSTQGNPFFIREVLRHLQESGVAPTVFDGDTRRLSFEDLDIPEGVRDVVERRLHRLSDRSAVALRTASAVGFTFGADLVAEVLETSELDLTTLLDEAVAARLVGEVAGRPGEYVFPHALIRYALYGDQTAGTRAALHARIGETLERLHADDLSPYLPELVRHFSRASERYREKLATYGRQAGELALSMLAYEDAVGSLSTVLGATSGSTTALRKERAELLVLLGTALTRSGEAQRARSSFLEAAELARTEGHARTLAEAALGYGAVAGFGGVWITFGVVDDVLVGLLEDALGMNPERDQALRARLLGSLAQALYWARDRERMLSVSEEALATARHLGDARALAQALDSRHVALWDPDHLEQREQLAQEMLTLGEQLDDRDIQLEAYAWLITDTLEHGRMDLVNRYVAAHVRLAEEVHQPYHLWYSRVVQAMQAQVAGNYEDLERLLTEAWEYGQKSHGENALQVYLVQSLVLRVARDEAPQILDDSGIAEYVAKSPLWGWWAALAYVATEADRPADAKKAIEHLTARGLDSLSHDAIWLGMMAWIAEVVVRLGDGPRAAEVYAMLLPYQQRVCGVGGGVLSLGPVARYLGQLARACGDHATALAHLEQARRTAETMRSTPEVLAADLEIVETLRARGAAEDAARASEILTSATTMAHNHGSPRLLRELERLVS